MEQFCDMIQTNYLNYINKMITFCYIQKVNYITFLDAELHYQLFL